MKDENSPMKIIKISLLAGALVAIAGTAAAQPQGPGRGPAAEVTRDQAIASADARFQRMDANRDGRVTTDELQQLRQNRTAQRGERRAERQGQAFERIDANRDGQISREEFAQRRAMRAERQAQRGDREMRGMRGPRGGQGQRAMRGMGGRMLGQDGVITIAEFRQQALQRFERMDANRDGRISVDERRSLRERARGGRRGPAPAEQD